MALNKLTDAQLGKAVRNTIKSGRGNLKLEDLMNYSLDALFTWEDTSEGQEYWRKLNLKTYNHVK